MTIDVTDATFETDVLERSKTTPVVVDLWAPWCGPCRTLGPIIEKVIDETHGKVVLAKVNVDDNPQVSAAFKVQGIPAVYALADGKVVDGFVGAQPEAPVRQFIEKLLPSAEDEKVAQLVAAGDEASLRRALEIDPAHEDAILALAELLVDRGDTDEALQMLGRIPETDRSRVLAARARVGVEPDDDQDATLTDLLDRVRDDDDARQQFVDILELMGPHDPRTASYRKLLTSRLF
jgi:putative thioredoxin